MKIFFASAFGGGISYFTLTYLGSISAFLSGLIVFTVILFLLDQF